MTILGKHTVAETRDLIRAVEFRVNKVVNQWTENRSRRVGPTTKGQALLDSDLSKFVDRWATARDKNTLSMRDSVLDAVGANPTVIPAEDEFKAINTAIDITNPRLIAVQGGVSDETQSQGITPIDFSGMPSQDSTDVDFAALKKLDSAIAAVGNPLGKPGSGPPTPGGLLSKIPWWGWAIGIGGVGAVGYSVVKTGQQVKEKAERDTKYIHENFTNKVLPGYKG